VIIRIIKGLLILVPFLINAQPAGWTTPINISNTETNSIYAKIATNNRGEIFVVWSEKDQPNVHPTLARIYFRKSSDGINWSETEILTPLLRSDYRPQIAVDTMGNPHIVWYEFNSGIVYYKYYNGTEWSEDYGVTDSTTVGWDPDIEIDNNNIVHIFWYFPTQPALIFYRYFDGVNWSTIDNVTESNGGFEVKADKNNDLHLVFGKRTVDYRESFSYKIYYKKRENGIWWLKTMQVNYDSLDSYDPDIVIRSDNTPLVVWEQEIEDTGMWGNKRQAYWSEFTGNRWLPSVKISEFSKARDPRIVKDNSNKVHLVFNGQSNIDLNTKGDSVYYVEYDGDWGEVINITGDIGHKLSYGAQIASINDELYAIWYTVLGRLADIFFTQTDTTTGVSEVLTSPDYNLSQNYPNPFNPVTTIRYSIKEITKVKLKVYDILGKEIITLVNGEKPAGEYEIKFDGSNLSSGIYFYSIFAGNYRAVKKMVLIR